MKNKIQKFLKISIIILIIFLIIIGIYTSLILNTKLVIKRSTAKIIGNVYSEYNKIKENKLLNKLNANTLNKKVLVDTEYENIGNDEVADKLQKDVFNNLKIVTDLSKTKNKFVNNTTFLYKDEEVLRLNTVIKDNKIYYGLPKILDKYVYTEKNIAKNTNEIEKKEIFYLINTTYNILLNSSNKQNMYNNSEKLRLEDKEISLIKHTLIINKTKQKEVIEKIYNRILKDEKYQNIVYKIYYSNLTKEEFLNIINDKLKNIDSIIFDNDYKFLFYIDPITTKIVKFDILKSNANDTELYEIFTKKTQNRDLKIIHSLNNSDKEIYEIRAIDDNNFVLLYTDEYFKATNKITINEEIKLQSEIYVNNEFKEKVEFELYEEERNIKGNLIVKKEKEYTLKFNINITNREGELLKEEDLHNATNLDNLTNDEIKQIKSKIVKSLLKSKFGKEMIKIFVTTSLANEI